MKVQRLASPDDLEASILAAARGCLEAGQLLLYPTDTLYAIGCRAADGAAAAQVRRAKGRDDAKPFPLIAGTLDQARSLAATWPEDAERLAARFWPGPLTLVLPLGAPLPAAVTAGESSVAVRVPAAAFARALCDGAGPLVATSANQSGDPGPRLFAQARDAVGAAAYLLVDAGTLPGTPSTIVDVTGVPRLLRAGVIPWSDVESALANRRS